MRSLIGGVLGILNKSPVPLTPRTGGGISVPFGMGDADDQSMAAMETNSTVYAIVHRVTEALAGVDWHLYRKASSGKEADRTLMDSHAALDLWNRPNSFFTRQAFVEYTSQHLILTGKTPWVLERVGNSPPLELWPATPNRIIPVKHPTKFMTGWLYKYGSEEIPLTLKEVIRPKIPRPSDPHDGLSCLPSLGVDLQSSRMAAEYNRMFFVNGAEPGGVAEVERRLSDDEFDELQARWYESHRGISKAHRIAILENGIKWVPNAHTRREMQFAELRTDSREVVREGFGMPKAMLGSVDDINRANAAANEVVFARWLLVGSLERYKAALNYELLPMFGKGVNRTLEFDYVNPVPDDVEAENAALTTKVTAAVALVNAGYDPAEVLTALGLPQIPFTGRPPQGGAAGDH